MGQRVHVLAIPYPSQGHVNPMLQFSRRLVSKGLKATLAITTYISNTMRPQSSTVQIDTISDGYDEGGFYQADSVQSYLSALEAAGSKSLAELIKKYEALGQPFDCIIYDAFIPWALDVAGQSNLAGAAFFTQACVVDYIYYLVHHGKLKVPMEPSTLPLSLQGLPLLQLEDMPSFIYVAGSYPAYFELLLKQFVNVHKADWVLVNTFYALESEVVDTMCRVCPLLTIGPTVPSAYLDNRVENDNEYGLNLFTLDDPSTCTRWLNTKPSGSVIYVSFGSMANLVVEQMEELAWGLLATNSYFLWVVRASEEAKLPKGLVEEARDKCLLVSWSPQMEVLSSHAIGCFFTHCGWNSTVEALSLGVPMVGMPQWTDQTTDAKFVQDVWKVGIRVKVDEKGIVRREEIERCIREVMEGERGKEMKKNAMKWSALAKEAVSEGGSTDKDVDQFVSQLLGLKA